MNLHMGECSEIFNLNYRKKLLIIKALNKMKSCAKAAKVLGISDSTLFRLRMSYGIMQIGEIYKAV